MTERLEKIYSLIPDGKGVIDVGTDHGYIPVQLASNGYRGRIIASDVNPAPLMSARQHAEEKNVTEKIEFTLCDGLDGCPQHDIDTIIIAGMGGDTICAILDRAEWCMDAGYTLILQPMTKAEILRFWLVNNGFEITGEYRAEDAGRIFQIIRSRYIGLNSRYTDAQLYIGKSLPHSEMAMQKRFVRHEAERLNKKLRGLQVNCSTECSFYETIVCELERE